MNNSESNPQNSGADRARRWFTVALGLVLLVLFFYMIKDLFTGAAAGILLWSMTAGMHQRWVKRLRGRRGAAAGISLVITIFVIIIPLALVGFLIFEQATTLTQQAQNWYEPYREQVQTRLDDLSQGRSVVIFDYEIRATDIVKRVEAASSQIGQFLLGIGQKIAGSLARLSLLIGVMLYTQFFFYLDGDAFLDWLKRLLPLKPEQSERLLRDFFATSRASLKTAGIIGLVQGTLGGLAFWICGIPAPLFFSVLMMVASLIPAVGVHIITIPAAIMLMFMGKIWLGIGLAIWSLVVVANVDNLLRPKLVKRDVDLHELLVFLSTVGGIITFGFFGIILGPVIASLLKVTLNMIAEDRV
jgi:predicted PurR-regulated permease PerM